MKNKKYDFSLNLTGLGDYTEQNTGLMSEALFASQTAGLKDVEILTGHKTNVKLNVLSHTITLQAASCGFNPNSSTIIEQVDIAVASLKYNETICPADFESKWQGSIMKAGSNPTDFPFSQFIVENKMEALAYEVDKGWWRASPFETGNLALGEGIFYHMSGKTSTYVSGLTFSSATIVADVDEMIAQSSDLVYTLPDFTMFMSIAIFKRYVAALRVANLYNYAQNLDGKSLTVEVPGSNVTVIGMSAFVGTDVVFLTPQSNIVLVTDLMDETDKITYNWFDAEDESRLKAFYKQGAGVNQPILVTHNQSTW